MHFSEVEHEVIGLTAVVDSLDSMVNHVMLRLASTDNETEVVFASPTHQQLFNVLLLDFLEKGDSNLTGVLDGSCLDVLQRVCRSPKFEFEDGRVEFLSSPVDALNDWFETEVVVESWFPSIDTHLELMIRRWEFVKICGNISKHNFTRLTRTSKQLVEILSRNGLDVNSADTFYVLDDFYSRFHTDIFAYHCTAMAELLNNVRWGIQNYLWMEFLRSYTGAALSRLTLEHHFSVG